MEKFEILKKDSEFKNKLEEFKKIIKLPELRHNIDKYEQTMASSDFWSDATTAQNIIETVNQLRNTISEYEAMCELSEELDLIISLADDAYLDEAEKIIMTLSEMMLAFETKQLLSGEYDSLNAFVELHPGAGGTESQDWAWMLYRMYKRYCERHKMTFELLDYQEALEAGIKSVTFLVKAKNAYGILKAERGVHRLVRISPFDSNARRHTSFASCNVTPEIKSFKDHDIQINPEDIRIDTYRSSGAGGQHVNTTDSAVRITHLPTGIVVACQNERSQIQNKEQALVILKSKLYERMHLEHENKLKNITGDLDDNAFGSQIRSHVLHPYAMVKDHRTNFESSNPNNVLDGDLDGFINAYLKKIATGEE